jgi:hypothetical protein
MRGMEIKLAPLVARRVCAAGVLLAAGDVRSREARPGAFLPVRPSILQRSRHVDSRKRV